jgi:predicted nucleic acid-binding protein
VPPPAEADARVLRLCLDVNVLVADFLSRRCGGPGGASSRIFDIVRNSECALGSVQMVVSWRMLTTLHIVLHRNLLIPDEQAWATCEMFAAVAEFGPLRVSPSIVLGGTGVLPMKDPEDIGVADAALALSADLLVTHDLDDFEAGSKANLSTERLQSKPNGKPAVLIIRDPARGDLLAAIPDVAIAWLRGETIPPVNITDYRL